MSCTFSEGLFSASFLLFSELDLLLLLLLLEDDELEEDLESCLLKLSFERDPLASISWRGKKKKVLRYLWTTEREICGANVNKCEVFKSLLSVVNGTRNHFLWRGTHLVKL